MRLSTAITAIAIISLLCFAGSRQRDSCAVAIRLVNSSTGRDLPGLLRIEDADGEPVEVAQLLSRGLGLEGRLGAKQDESIHRWSVLAEGTTVHLPRGKLTIEAFSGLETESTTVRLDLTDKQTAQISIPLVRFHDAAARGYRSGNTHLHLMKITREQSDRYLAEVPKADGLDLLFLSYLERAVEDRDYISNRYTDGDLASLTRKSGVVFGNGEEHRHNFSGFGQGYGHVMFLNIKQLIQPVSIGPGIMKMGTDGIPLQRGIDTARRDGATVIWCHNDFGREDLPNLATGRLDAQNIFDGGIRSSYKDSYYRYLNAGWQVPFSTGTDWFMYDFSRVYVDVEGEPTVENWLDALAEGQSYITNGPLLEFTVDGKKIGDTVSLGDARTVAIEATAVGRADFEQIEIVHNGRVRWTAPSRRVGGHYEASLSLDVDITSPCWLALRTPPSPIESDPDLQAPVGKNEFGRWLFAHTSPIYVEVAGRRHFDRSAAQGLYDETEKHRSEIARIGNFADEQERARVLDVYTTGLAAMKQHMQRMMMQRK